MAQPIKKVEVSTTSKTETNPTIEGKAIALMPETKRAEKPLSIKEIIEKHNSQAKRIEKLERLNSTHKKLDSFKLGSDRLKDSLTIEDGERNEFTTNNSEIIAKIIELIKTEVLEKVVEIEKEIELNEI